LTTSVQHLREIHYLLWERACPRKRCTGGWCCRLCHRLRDQARSHTGDGGERL